MRTLLLALFATLFFVACSGPSPKEDQKAIEKEALKNDSIALKAEKVTEDLQKSISKVDSLVNEL